MLAKIHWFFEFTGGLLAILTLLLITLFLYGGVPILGLAGAAFLAMGITKLIGLPFLVAIPIWLAFSAYLAIYVWERGVKPKIITAMDAMSKA